MKRVLPISCVMLALTASAALAGWLNLNWGPECASDGVVGYKTFACDTNDGSSVMVVSFAPSASHEHLLGVDAVIDGQVFFDPVISDWWQFKNVGACRVAALSTNTTISANAVNCRDPWGGQASSAITYYGDPLWVGTPTPPVQGHRARIKVSCSVPEGTASAVEAELEYFVFNVVVDHTRTVGAASCTGCLRPMCWMLNSIMVEYMDGGVLNQETAATPSVNFVITWQSSTDYACYVSTLNKTWGQIKSLYR
jgi:hypothetical protein